MKLPIYQIDAFTSQIFAGNPAAVCPLEEWLPEESLQKIASENNLSETAFFVPNNNGFDLRWFTPSTEVDLCGHATLASAYVVFRELAYRKSEVVFSTKSGELIVKDSGDLFSLDFPTQRATKCLAPKLLLQSFNHSPIEVYSAEDYLLIFEEESQIHDLSPDFSLLLGLPLRGVIVSSKSRDYDFVSRWFGPNVGVNEDPVTGSAHTTLAPYWASKLGKTKLKAKQISTRGGELECELKDDRVLLYGNAVKYLEGSIFV